MIWAVLLLVLLGAFWYYQRYKKLTSTSFLLEQLAVHYDSQLRRINQSHLHSYLDQEQHFLTIMHENALRLFERFRHDDKRLREVMQDWAQYLDLMREVVFNREMVDVAPSNEDADRGFENIRELRIKAEEIENRYKSLLGSDYKAPYEHRPREKSLKEVI